ncbi:MAG: type I DNA topoisomerase [Actinobacteria bacterium]|nr:MAG: type I DNA topoisomerase [Actinomycetota bacterium]
MPKPLVIVESPAKAKTIAGFLGRDVVVESSIGHIRDLPRSAADVPPALKAEPWARLGVDVDNGFKPLYVVAKEKKAQVSKLKSLLRDASEVYLATDEDREGESIAWHLMEVLAPRVPVKRMVFHEITRHAIEQAVDDWRDLDRRLVDAQEARRILDRLYGYEVSPVLWKKVLPKLSAGRVQSVATRILVERERARIRFRSASWWDLEGRFSRDAQPFSATLVSLDDKRLATGKDFSETGELRTPKGSSGLVLLDEPRARDLVARLGDASFTVTSVEEKPFKRSPYAPFTTSTLQQEAGRKLRFSSARTMQTAQRLYENGYITYMRTDSTALSTTAVTAARDQAAALYGAEYVPPQPRRHDRKVKNAQEAHEAIRPAGESFRQPDQVASEVSQDEARLYDLVWKRTVASQMADAHGMSVQVRLAGVAASANGTPAAGERAEFAASGKVITFPGFLRAYVEGADDPEAELEDREVHLPRLAADDAVDQEALEARSHATQPPSRYTEASLVKALEELGVGRPSTYATIISTIQDRGYVWKKGSALVPSFIAFAVVGLLERHFTDLVDYGFTASMEDDLDEIADGQEEAIPWLSRFYFGNGKPGLKATVSGHLDEIDAREVNSIPIGLDGGGEQIMLRVGRYGPYVQRGEDRASVPDDVAPDELTVERAKELLAAPSGDRVLGQDPSSGLPVLVRAGRYGPYVQLGEGDPGSKTKPRTSSLFQTMSPDTLSLDDALRLLSLPRVVGTDPSDGAEILALNGRFGPYLKKGDDSRSLSAEEQLFSVTLDEALAIFAQPKQRGGRRAAAAPLRELGEDPTTGGSMVLRSGRFGPYVTDGEVNASLRRGDDPDSLTPERAAELLAEKRAAGPAPPRKSARARRSTKAAKKASTKKAAASTNSAGASRAGAKKAGTKKAAATKKKATARKTGGATGRTATRTRS